MDETGTTTGANIFVVEPLLMKQLKELVKRHPGIGPLVSMCREINSSHAHGNVLATALLMRTVLNYVPPIFGCATFAQLVANTGKSLKESFIHLEEGLRKVS